MKEYIFYTTEGFTHAPDGDDIENCQLLGKAFGNDKNEALKNLQKENPWIKDRCFNLNKAVGKELATTSNAETKLTFLMNLLNEHQLEEYMKWLKSNDL